MAKLLTSEKNCETCEYFSKKQANYTQGTCHYNPPVYVQGGGKNNFPRVDNNKFCGKYKNKVVRRVSSSRKMKIGKVKGLKSRR